MPFCEECGAKIESDATFCEKCLHTISKNNQVKNEPVQEIQGKKNPILAAVCSLVIPGLGQVYVGDIIKGIAIFFGTLIGIVIWIIPGLIVWVFGIYDAYTIAQKTNNGEYPFKKTRINLKMALFYLCLIFSGFLFILSSVGFFKYIIGEPEIEIGVVKLGFPSAIIAMLGYFFLCIYFFYKIRKSPDQTTESNEKYENEKKRLRVPLFIILILGIFFAGVIFNSYFTIGIINPPNDGKCDYDNAPGTIKLLIQNQTYHEFCPNHMEYYLMLNPTQIMSIQLEETNIYYKQYASLITLFWGIFLLFAVAATINFPSRNKGSFFIWKNIDWKLVKPLLMGFLAGSSFIFFLLQGVTENKSPPIFILLLLSALLLIFSISIILDSRK